MKAELAIDEAWSKRTFKGYVAYLYWPPYDDPWKVNTISLKAYKKKSDAKKAALKTAKRLGLEIIDD